MVGSPQRTKSYLIHDNGSRPFRVDVRGKSVQIYSVSGNWDDEVVVTEYKTLVIKAMCKKFIPAKI